MTNANSITIDLAWYNILSEFSETLRRRVFDAVLQFAATGQRPSFKGQAKLAFELIAHEVSKQLTSTENPDSPEKSEFSDNSDSSEISDYSESPDNSTISESSHPSDKSKSHHRHSHKKAPAGNPSTLIPYDIGDYSAISRTSTSKMRVEPGGIVPAPLLPYASLAGM